MNDTTNSGLSGVILAGGASRRMGRDKAWVELAGRPLVEHVCARLGEICAELVIVTNNPTPFARLDVRVVGDVWPGSGSLGGIYSGLLAAQSDQAIVVACDMPFLNANLIGYMRGVSGEYDLVIPSAPDPSKPPKRQGAVESAKDHDLHPLHAIYGKRCLEPMAVRIQAGDLRAISFYPDVRVRMVSEAEVDRFDARHLSLFNINTADDLALAEQLTNKA